MTNSRRQQTEMRTASTYNDAHFYAVENLQCIDDSGSDVIRIAPAQGNKHIPRNFGNPPQPTAPMQELFPEKSVTGPQQQSRMRFTTGVQSRISGQVLIQNEV